MANDGGFDNDDGDSNNDDDDDSDNNNNNNNNSHQPIIFYLAARSCKLDLVPVRGECRTARPRRHCIYPCLSVVMTPSTNYAQQTTNKQSLKQMIAAEARVSLRLRLINLGKKLFIEQPASRRPRTIRTRRRRRKKFCPVHYMNSSQLPFPWC